MNVLVQLSHPAHFHLYARSIKAWKEHGASVFVIIKTKDILEELLLKAQIPYHNIMPIAHRKSKLGILYDLLNRDLKLIQFSKKNNIDILTGSTPEVSHVSWLLRKMSVNTGEDDAPVVPLFGKVVGHTMQTMLSPEVCENGPYELKSVKYNSYHELAYLHPNHFTANIEVVSKYFNPEKPYFILRFAQLTAYHDIDAKAYGINTDVAQHLIDLLKPHGDIYITSERELEPQFEQYRIKINPLDMHHVMAFAQLYIGDSQTMAAEAGVLGVPFVRFNDFVGRIGYLRELEDVYHLGYGVKASAEGPERMYEVVEQLLSIQNRREVFQERRQKMLSEKIDYAKFLTWFVENYPESKRIMKENPDYQYNFR